MILLFFHYFSVLLLETFLPNFAVDNVFNMKKYLLVISCALVALPSSALNDTHVASGLTLPSDSSKVIDIEEAIVVGSPKQTGKLRSTSNSVSLFSEQEVYSLGIRSLADISGYAPNFFMPEYGSSQTSAIYIRGVGSRINTPAIGLYVDNVPVADKSAYDFNLLGVSRIDVLRGSQGTLYGRNAMGGLLRIYTRNPLKQPGTTVHSGASTRDGMGYVSALTGQKINNSLGVSFGGFWKSSKGIWHNDTLGQRTGGRDQFGGRVRLVYEPTNNWHFDYSASYEYTDEKAYPYFYNGVVKGSENMSSIVGSITANRDSKYRRGLFNTSLSTQYETPQFTLSSVTGFQNLDDRMMMDQDFIYLDYYTLEQRQKANTLTEEIVLKSIPGKRLEWTGGVFGMWETMRTNSPVTFYNDGVDMINNNIGRYLPAITYTNPLSGKPLSMPLSLKISDPSFVIPGYFRTPVLNGAAFFQSTLHDVFFSGFDITLGLRLDYERQWLNYTGGGGDIHYLFSMPMIQPANLVAQPALQGKIANSYTRLLPKVALQYNLEDNKGNVYISFSEGQRAGGYNIQMFSDILSSQMSSDMMQGTKTYCVNLLQQLADNAKTPVLKNMFEGIKKTVEQNVPEPTTPDVKNTVTYKPEYCLNYEAGTHLNFFNQALTADLSVFFMDVHNQQIARFVSSGLGRMMVNAGRSYSCGIEASLRSNLCDNRLALALNYGYTHAEFHKYNAGGNVDYSGNRVPFIPEHNIGLYADFTQPLKGLWLKSLTVGINGSGFGRIYWTEANNAYQNFHAIAGAHALLNFGDVELDLWGKNITQTHYKTFYFESMNRGYFQKGSPLQLGFDFRFNF